MLKNIYLFTTNRCDLHCQHCLQGFPETHSDFPVELLDQLLSEGMLFGAKHVGLTGGEAHLHPEFPKIIETIVRYGYTWGFVSHGQRTEPYLPLMERYRANFKNVHLSIDSTIPELHDEIRLRRGAFEKVIASAKTYVEHGFPVWINASLNQKNKAEVKGTIPADWNRHLVLNDNESLALYQEIISLKETAKIKIDFTSALYTAGGIWFCGLLSLYGLSVNSRGEVTFCCDTQQNKSIIGSLREKPLSELIRERVEISSILQKQRISRIVEGNLEEGFDTCAFCNSFFSPPQ
jgi:organic radical activating enzyme